MHTPTGGRLLDKVAYCLKPKCKTTNIVDDKIEVRDTFPYNPESKTAPATAKRWAQGYGWRDHDKYEPEVILRNNEPFTITITDLHVRSEGGRAYKVIDGEMRRFDLREDQVLEVMGKVGILPMGVVPGTFVWGILGSQVRLVLVGGDLHQSMVQGANDKKEFERAQSAGEHPTEATLVPGRIYRKKDKSIHAFIGKVKRKGIDKMFYAFIQMPTKDPPAEVDDEDIDEIETADDRWKKARKHDRQVARQWETLTWRAKCNFEWDERYNMYRLSNESKYVHYEHIMLMSSPKFEADVGVLEDDFFQEIKANEGRRHDYVDGNKNSIVSTEFKKAYPNERGYLAVGDVWQSYNDRAHEQRMTAAWRNMKDDFYKGLVWS